MDMMTKFFIGWGVFVVIILGFIGWVIIKLMHFFGVI